MSDENIKALTQLYGRMATDKIAVQIASGRLSSAATDIAEQELQRRTESENSNVASTESNTAADKNEQALSYLYEGMPTDKIEAQIATGRLSSMAGRLAGHELQKRTNPEASAGAAPARNTKLPTMMIVAILVQAVLVVAVSFLLHFEFTGLVILMEVCVVASIVAKAFPRIGITIGTILVTAPIWLYALYWYQGYLTWRTWFISVILFFVSLFAMVIGSHMLAAARFTGTWEEFFRWLQSNRTKALNTMKRIK